MLVVIESRINPIALANIIHYLKEEHGINPGSKSQAIRLAVTFAAEFVPDIFKEDETRALNYITNEVGELNRQQKISEAVKEAKQHQQEDIEQAIKDSIMRFKEEGEE
jgi:hypothetical protein